MSETASTNAPARGRRRTFKGYVVSNDMQKTIAVATTSLVKHPKYGKYIRRTAKLLAHDEKSEAKKGDFVEITEARPLSKRKHFRLSKILRAAPE